MKKLNKKGFTLIELLAVIAILAILVVIAVPGVLNMYNNAKKDTFETQAKEIWKSLETQYISDSINGQAKDRYCYSSATKVSTTSTQVLDLTGNKSLYYDFKLTNGVITGIIITDGTYSYKAVSAASIDNITAQTAAVTINCTTTYPAS